MAGKSQDLLKQFGPEADPKTTFKSTQIAAAIGVALYVFNRRVLNGAFPKPDFVKHSLRAWKLETVKKNDPDLAARLLNTPRC